MSEAEDRAIVVAILESAGLTVERIPEADLQRCDLRACREAERYLIEIKSANDDERVGAAIAADGVFAQSRPHLHRPTLRKAVDYAVRKQLCETRSFSDEFCVIAIPDRTRNGGRISERQICGTLYGTMGIIDVDRVYRDCLYFRESAFFRHRSTLDAAIVILSQGAMLCLNDHSSRKELVRESTLGRFFAERGASNDAVSLERDGGFLVADCDIPRGRESDVLDYVRRKYGLVKPISIEFTEYIATALVRPSKALGRLPERDRLSRGPC